MTVAFCKPDDLQISVMKGNQLIYHFQWLLACCVLIQATDDSLALFLLLGHKHRTGGAVCNLLGNFGAVIPIACSISIASQHDKIAALFLGLSQDLFHRSTDPYTCLEFLPCTETYTQFFPNPFSDFNQFVSKFVADIRGILTFKMAKKSFPIVVKRFG